jgi:hypothetical protein
MHFAREDVNFLSDATSVALCAYFSTIIMIEALR